MLYAGALPNYSADFFGTGKAGFQDGNAGIGLYPTQLSATWFNGVTGEIATAIELVGGLTVGAALYSQLATAISNQIRLLTNTVGIKTPVLNNVAGGTLTIGTTDAQDLILKAGNATRLTLKSDGTVNLPGGAPSTLIALDSNRNFTAVAYATACGPNTVPFADASARIKAHNAVDDVRDLLIANVAGGFSNGCRVALKRNNITMGYVDGDFFYGLRFGTTRDGTSEATEAGGFDLDGKFYVSQLTANRIVSTNATNKFESVPYTTTGAASSLVKTNGALTASRMMVTNSAGELASASDYIANILGVAGVSMGSGSTYYDILSSSVPAGRWFVHAKMEYHNASTAGAFSMFLNVDGTDVAQAFGDIPSDSNSAYACLSKPITLTATTTVKLRALASAANGDAVGHASVDKTALYFVQIG